MRRMLVMLRRQDADKSQSEPERAGKRRIPPRSGRSSFAWDGAAVIAGPSMSREFPVIWAIASG